jgi:transposase
MLLASGSFAWIGRMRYSSDLTDDEWKLVELLIPPGKRCGGKRIVIMPEAMNGGDAASSPWCFSQRTRWLRSFAHEHLEQISESD